MVQDIIGYLPSWIGLEGLNFQLVVALGTAVGTQRQAGQPVLTISCCADISHGSCASELALVRAICWETVWLLGKMSGCFIDPVNKKRGGKFLHSAKDAFLLPPSFGPLPLFKFKQICYPNICSLIIWLLPGSWSNHSRTHQSVIYSLACDYNGFILVGPLFTSSFVLVHSVIITMAELLGLAETIAHSKWLQLAVRCLSALAAQQCL